MSQDCVFCQIHRGELPSDTLYKDGRCFAIRNIRPEAPVHLLILPVRHFTYLADMTSDDEGMIGYLFKVARDVAEQEGLADRGYRLAINQGPDSGQEVAHLHLHLLGGRRLESMG